MRVLCLNLAEPRHMEWRGRKVLTGIYKTPVNRPVRATLLGFEGDLQADKRVHGGPAKAIYAYPSEHYAHWRALYPQLPMPWGWFGENLTTEGFLESDFDSGDRVRIGGAVLEVTTPRQPCFKLATKFGTLDILEQFSESGKSGLYFAVVEEGSIEAGDEIIRLP
jgi:MOSC domain-containing protein YiiM